MLTQDVEPAFDKVGLAAGLADHGDLWPAAAKPQPCRPALRSALEQAALHRRAAGRLPAQAR
ncbi:MAG: hypothetical protein ACUVSX_16220, partial [Aggregatilineales bacterium]